MIKFETDSRLIKKGQTFVAIKGHTVDGHDFINNAIQNGATEIIAEHDINVNVPYKVVNNSEDYLKEELKKLYADKINQLKIIGVTGTSGKTTTCYLIYQLLKQIGVKVGYLGTIGFYYDDKVIETNNTTPDTLTLYKLFNDAIDEGITTIVMEVSSHSLAMDRMHGMHLDLAGYTNLSLDHLDYHKTMENYLQDKLKIFNLLNKNGTIVINSDDEYSNRFIELANKHETIGYNGSYKIINFNTTASETNLIFEYNQKKYNVTIELTSKFNVYNYLMALALCHEYGIEIDEIIKYSKKIYPPKGRCETIKVNKGYAIVDYAHKPDAVEKVITAYNDLKKNRIITIIGCGGDRDASKRPIMGNLATNLSDYVILTNDNPRTEDPHKIMEDILTGIKTNNYEIEFDRKKAIKKGITMMEPEDILLILGKGHEDYQIIGHEKHHLDDVEEVKNWCKEA